MWGYINTSATGNGTNYKYVLTDNLDIKRNDGQTECRDVKQFMSHLLVFFQRGEHADRATDEPYSLLFSSNMNPTEE